MSRSKLGIRSLTVALIAVLALATGCATGGATLTPKTCAAIGALAGGAGGALAPGLAQRAAAAPGLGAASRFGQRQIHSLTGVGDASYVRSIGGGAADAKQRFDAAKKGLEGASGVTARQKALGEVQSAQKHFQSAEKAEAAGLTSIPGYVKAMAKDPIGALSTGIRGQWHSMGPGGKALMFGAPAAGAANELRKKQEDPEHRGRFERAGRILGGAASGMIAPLSIVGDVAAGGALSSGLGRTGRWVDNLNRRRRPTPSSEQEPGGGTVQASENVLSDRAAGSAAESVAG